MHAFISDYIDVKTVQSSMQPNWKQLNWKLSGVVEREAEGGVVENRGETWVGSGRVELTIEDQ